jgi:hypothetical protein
LQRQNTAVETPPVSSETVATTAFAIAIVASTSLSSVVDVDTFSGPLAAASASRLSPRFGVFTNLGGDASLIAPQPSLPSPTVSSPSSILLAAHAHFSSWLRAAADVDVHELLRVAATVVSERISLLPLTIAANVGTGRSAAAAVSTSAPVWLSTSGDGVAYLHVRVDARPNYYQYRPFAAWPPPREGYESQVARTVKVIRMKQAFLNK